MRNKRAPRLSRPTKSRSQTMTTAADNETLKRGRCYFPLFTAATVTQRRVFVTLTTVHTVMEDCLLIWLFVFMRAIRRPRYIYSVVARGKAAVFGSHAVRRVCVCVHVQPWTHTPLSLLRGGTCNAALLLCRRLVHKTVYTLQSLFI